MIDMPYEFLLENPAYMYALIIATLLLVAAVLIWHSAKLRRDAARHEARAAEEQARAAEEHARIEVARAEKAQRELEAQAYATMEAEANADVERLRLEQKAQDIDRMHVRKDLLKLESIVYQYSEFIFGSMTGKEFENFFAYLIGKNGYTNVVVTQASGDYGGDVLATGLGGKRVCFQCKYHASDVGVSAVQEVFAATKYYKCDIAAVISRKSYTKQAKDLAARIGVLLFDGRYITDLMETCLAELQYAVQYKADYYNKHAEKYEKERKESKESENGAEKKPFTGKDECAVNLDQAEANYTFRADQ